jgi:hypothetical protein
VTRCLRARAQTTAYCLLRGQWLRGFTGAATNTGLPMVVLDHSQLAIKRIPVPTVSLGPSLALVRAKPTAYGRATLIGSADPAMNV